MSGGFDETARYLGSSEMIMDVDGEKLGLWPGCFFRVAAKGRFGRNVLEPDEADRLIEKLTPRVESLKNCKP